MSIPFFLAFRCFASMADHVLVPYDLARDTFASTDPFEQMYDADQDLESRALEQ